MNAKDVASDGLRMILWVAGTAVSVPVVTGFVVLGAAVLVGRSLLDGVRRTRGMVRWAVGRQREKPLGEPKAA